MSNQNDRSNRQKQLDNAALAQADFQPSPVSMYVMGMCSDVQECIRLGNLKLANEILNDIKLIIDQRMATKDEHGRHDYAPGELAARKARREA